MDAQCDLKLTPQATYANWLPDMKEWEFAAFVISHFHLKIDLRRLWLQLLILTQIIKATIWIFRKIAYLLSRIKKKKINTCLISVRLIWVYSQQPINSAQQQH